MDHFLINMDDTSTYENKIANIEMYYIHLVYPMKIKLSTSSNKHLYPIFKE